MKGEEFFFIVEDETITLNIQKNKLEEFYINSNNNNVVKYKI